MALPTSDQYRDAVEKLSAQHKEILKFILESPGSSATAKQVAQHMGYSGFQGASLQVGNIGKKIWKETGIEPGKYVDRYERTAYFLLVGVYTEEKGWQLRRNLKQALRDIGFEENPPDLERLPTEFSSIEGKLLAREGKLSRVLVNRYERDRKARKACIDRQNAVCEGCGFEFGKFYGPSVEGFLEVHHTIPLH